MPRINLKNILILDGLRTPIGSPGKSLKDFTAAELAAVTFKEIVRRNKINPHFVNEVILGNTVSAGTGQNLSRQAVFLAKLPASVPALTINNVCGSGLQSIVLAAQVVACDDARLIIAGGAESATHNPFIVNKKEYDKIAPGDLVDSLIHDGLWCRMANKHMGELAELTAEEFHVSREAQDQYALNSHQKACRAQSENKFAQEIVAVALKEGEVFNRDDHPHKNFDLELLRYMPLAFKKEGGTVTAGNASIPGDGAAAVIVVSAEAVKKYKLTPRARLLSYATVALEPQRVFTAAILAVNACLKKGHISLKEIDLFEISEAFAVQAMVTRDRLKIPEEKMNVFGGDIAFGHPLGAAGARALVTLLHALHDQKKKRGLAAVCLGGGGAVAMAVERI